jgi:cyclic pyranopterin monophosphate synthase
MADFTHLTAEGRATMVDIGDKHDSRRLAIARCAVRVKPDTLARLASQHVQEIASAARVAGVMAAKRTAELIPFCHAISIAKADIEIAPDREKSRFIVTATTQCTGRTGVEMEALVACSIAAATIYDMIKAVDPGATIEQLHVAKKDGGKLGTWTNQETTLN